MQADLLHSFVKNPAAVIQANPSELKKLTDEFPYFQTAHLLLALSSKENDASLFQNSIKKAAIVSVSRKRLYDLLYKQNFKKQQKQQEINLTEKNSAVQTTEELPLIEAQKQEKAREEINIEKEPLLEKTLASEKSTEHKKPEFPGNEEIRQAELILQIEKEVEKEIVESFVEKQLLKTHETFKKENAPPPNSSFTGWLQWMKQNSDISVEGGTPLKPVQENQGLQKHTSEKTDLKKKHKQEILDRIIELNPGAIKLKQDTKFFVANQKAKESLAENEDLVTETLAKIYALQGNTAKAIRTYEILSLKFPNKSAYFASQIDYLKKNQ